MKIGIHEYEVADGQVVVDKYSALDRSRPINIRGVKGMENSFLNTEIPIIPLRPVWTISGGLADPGTLGLVASEEEGRQVAVRFGMEIVCRPHTLDYWLDAKARLADAKQAVVEAEVALKKADKQHREQYPLSLEMKKRIIEAFDGGQKLCCGSGREFLESLGLDENWVEHLNEWAYDTLACTPNTLSKTGRYHDETVEILRKKMEKC